MKSFCFESYGVRVRIESSSTELLKIAIGVARNSLLGRLSQTEASEADHPIVVNYRRGQIWLNFDGEDLGPAVTEAAFLNYFDTRIRLLIGEYAPKYVFLHAGVVAWRGKALIFPGDSFAGKSTLVAELVRCGAEYLSDEYAILDSKANVLAFPRPIALRPPGDPGSRLFISHESLNGRVPTRPVPPGVVLLTEYKPRARWNPIVLAAGQGILETIPHAISIRAKTNFTLQVLKRLAERAILCKSLRGNAGNTSQKIIDYVDKSIF